jgi:hypothetical protein
VLPERVDHERHEPPPGVWAAAIGVGGPGVRAGSVRVPAQLAQGEDDRHDDSAHAGHGDGAAGKLGAS